MVRAVENLLLFAFTDLVRTDEVDTQGVPRDGIRQLCWQFAVLRGSSLVLLADGASLADLLDRVGESAPSVMLAKSHLQTTDSWMAQEVVVPFGCSMLQSRGNGNLPILVDDEVHRGVGVASLLNSILRIRQQQLGL